MEANLISITAVCTPILAIPLALFFGLRKTLIVVIAICALLIVVPYAIFAVWALIEGAPVWQSLGALSVSFPAVAVIVGWMLVWSAAYGAIAAALRLGWLYWRGKLS